MAEQKGRREVSTFGFNTGYIEELYTQYLQNPESVGERWKEFFADYVPSETFLPPSEPGASEEMPSGDGSVGAPSEARVTAEQGAPVAVPYAPPQPPIPEDAAQSPIKGVPAKIVDNMEASLSVPTATSVRHVPVKLLTENRRLINNHQKYAGGFKVSFTHLVAWAIVKALHAVPSLNTSFRRDDGTPALVEPGHVNIGLAIDMQRSDGSHSLVVPNIKKAEKLNFARFMGVYNDLVRRARKGKLEVSDFEGTTVTLTNPGMIGTVMSVPRLMVGQGLIVATGSIGYPAEYSAMPPEVLSRMGLSPVMTLTSTYDHRVIQGAESGRFLSHVAALLQGEHDFYKEVFSDLHIPQPPLAAKPDTSPFIGRREEDEETEIIRKQAAVIQLIRIYRVRGHLIADIDPLGTDVPFHPELDPATYGLTIWDLDRKWITDALTGEEVLPLREILDRIWKTYTRTIGVEFMHISDPEEKRWILDRIENGGDNDEVTPERRRQISSKLNAAEAFERFLHTKYIGHKRFSLEGAETMIPMLDRILSDAADQGVTEVVIGMAHRGRLNVLANTLGKPYATIFSEFEGSIDPQTTQGSGDVKYHLGAQGTHRSQNGNEVRLTLASNPSHLEAVNPVVEGMARAKQRLIWNDEKDHSANFDQVIPLLIHGDAAFSGQGVVAETLNLSQLDGYTTGGTIHIVINNQIGFTTAPIDARSSTYATDVARMIQAPIFHLNGDDPEAAVRIAGIALDYRQEFNKDVVIDLVCYRVHGHNEGDEPTFTQPQLYKRIEQHRSVRKLYTEKLLRRGDMEPEEAERLLEDFQHKLVEAFEETKELIEKERPSFKPAPIPVDTPVQTSVSRENLEDIVNTLTDLPEQVNVHHKLRRLFGRRRDLFEKGRIDWSFAEALATGSLLLEGTQVRISGEDSGRGTFSQRHAVLVDQVTEENYVPLNHIRPGQAELHAFDSLLSEYAVLGFEYGYAVADPETLVIWEAQFGDFINGGQIVIDQFIVVAEQKWGDTSRLVMLLPHGYEGQGPEHSSARLERFLQLSAQHNLRVCNMTTPANYFHALRRQIHSTVAKPLVVMAPKSMLRNPQAVSKPEDLTDSAFMPVIPAEISSDDSVERLVFCSGKVYYDLMQYLYGSENRSKIAITRLEQFYPFPDDQVKREIQRFPEAEVVWTQEEPKNMGGWGFVQPRFNTLLGQIGAEDCRTIAYIGRPPGASTATGSAKRHAEEQEKLVTETVTLD